MFSFSYLRSIRLGAESMGFYFATESESRNYAAKNRNYYASSRGAELTVPLIQTRSHCGYGEHAGLPPAEWQGLSRRSSVRGVFSEDGSFSEDGQLFPPPHAENLKKKRPCQVG